ncbi:MAG TPA: STAS domain-containing protein [bacterium]|jgi:anti-sigma B factor antagonist
MEISRSAIGNVRILRVSGQMNHVPFEALKKILHDQYNESKKVIIDMVDITHLDSSGLGQLVAAFKTSEAMNGELILVGVNDDIRKAMEDTKLVKLFRFADSIEEAMEIYGEAHSLK